MYQRLTATDVAEALRKDQYGAWTYGGSIALAEYLEELEDDMGKEMELDVVALRCDYTEYENAVDAVENYDYPPDGDTEEEMEADALHWLENHTTVIEFNGGIIVQSF
jgi:hypothetical protein